MNDSAKTPVARFHRRQCGIISNSSNSLPANTLEIYEAGKDMVDLIVVTGVYIEKLRREREKASESAAAVA